jgi:hypothetical protein
MSDQDEQGEVAPAPAVSSEPLIRDENQSILMAEFLETVPPYEIRTIKQVVPWIEGPRGKKPGEQLLGPEIRLHCSHITGLGALVVNPSCAFILARVRDHHGSLTRAAFLSARNDALANVAIIAAGLITAITLSVWPDLIVGIGIFVMNLDASRQVYATARDERRTALAEP